MTILNKRPETAVETILFVYEDGGLAGIYGISPTGEKRIPFMVTNPAASWIGDFFNQAPTAVKRYSQLTLEKTMPHSPAWSANGRVITYRNRLVGKACDELVLMDVFEKEPRSLACLSRDNRVEAVDWASDGGHIAFTLRGNRAAQIRVLNAEGQQTHQFQTEGFVWGLAWSPDSTRIAATTDGDSTLQLFSLEESVINLQPEAAAFGKPTWSPDGKSIAFFCYAEEKIDICTINTDGTGSQRFSFAPEFPYLKYHLQWSPDGENLLFEAQQRGGNEDIFLVNRDGSDLKQLTFHPASDTEPAWSPDGSQITFVSLRDGNKEIYTIQADGTGLSRLTNTPGAETQPTWKPMTP